MNLRKEYVDEMKNGKGSEISDEFHTMSELYYNRMVLTAVILNQNSDISWKSRLHDDGGMFEGFFVVGIDTPEGQYGYHYQLKYWDLFQIPELPLGKPYDGYTKEDIGRLLSIVK